MSLKEFLNAIKEDESEKVLQKITDSILDFFIVKTPKAIAKEAKETYSWLKDGVKFTKDSIANLYKRNCDAITLARLLQEKEKGKSFCDIDYKAGEIVCKYSKLFYNKSLIKYFCKESNKAPDTSTIIKKNNSRFHKGYCICSTKIIK